MQDLIFAAHLEYQRCSALPYGYEKMNGLYTCAIKLVKDGMAYLKSLNKYSNCSNEQLLQLTKQEVKNFFAELPQPVKQDFLSTLAQRESGMFNSYAFHASITSMLGQQPSTLETEITRMRLIDIYPPAPPKGLHV